MIRIGIGLVITSRITKKSTDFNRGTDIISPGRVLISSESRTPFAWGWRRPVVVLPEIARNWPEEKLRMVLRHESTHIVHHDPFWMILTEIVRALNWFNPLAWMVRKRLIIESEKSCDDAVIAGGANPEHYSGYLIEIIKDIGRPGFAAPVAVQMARYNQMEGRIMSILNGKMRKIIISRKALFGLALLTAFMVFGLATCSDTSSLKGSTVSEAPKPPKEVREPAASTDSAVSPTEPDPADNSTETVYAAAPEKTRNHPDITDAVPSSDEFIPVDTMPVMIYQETPVYPPEAKAKKIEGVVYIRSFVDKEGTVRKAQIAKSSGNDMLDQAALDAGMKARFTPAKKDGKPVGIWITYSVQFSLEERNHP